MPTRNNCSFWNFEAWGDVDSYVRMRANKFSRTGIAYNLLDLKSEPIASADIDIIRDSLARTIPFRGKFCGMSAIRCCGSCTRACTCRCLQDIYTKLDMYLGMNCKMPYREHIHECDYLTRTVYDTLISPSVTYEMLCNVCNQLISVTQNTKLGQKFEKGRTGMYSRRELNSWRFDYAPQPVYYEAPKTGRLMRQVDKETGKIHFREWPDTGLCPYCVPTVTVDKHYVK